MAWQWTDTEPLPKSIPKIGDEWVHDNMSKFKCLSFFPILLQQWWLFFIYHCVLVDNVSTTFSQLHQQLDVRVSSPQVVLPALWLIVAAWGGCQGIWIPSCLRKTNHWAHQISTHTEQRRSRVPGLDQNWFQHRAISGPSFGTLQHVYRAHSSAYLNES